MLSTSGPQRLSETGVLLQRICPPTADWHASGRRTCNWIDRCYDMVRLAPVLSVSGKRSRCGRSCDWPPRLSLMPSWSIPSPRSLSTVPRILLPHLPAPPGLSMFKPSGLNFEVFRGLVRSRRSQRARVVPACETFATLRALPRRSRLATSGVAPSSCCLFPIINDVSKCIALILFKCGRAISALVKFHRFQPVRPRGMRYLLPDEHQTRVPCNCIPLLSNSHLERGPSTGRFLLHIGVVRPDEGLDDLVGKSSTRSHHNTAILNNN